MFVWGFVAVCIVCMRARHQALWYGGDLPLVGFGFDPEVVSEQKEKTQKSTVRELNQTQHTHNPANKPKKLKVCRLRLRKEFVPPAD